MVNLHKWLASFFGLGFVPGIPGTAGTLGAIPLFLWWSVLTPSLYFLTVLAFTLFSGWICRRALPFFQDPRKPGPVPALRGREANPKDLRSQKDPSKIVIDEVAGFLWALGIVRYFGFWKPDEGLIWLILIPFVFFRLLDVTKWGLVGWVERKWAGAAGIVLDDVAAGVLAGVFSLLFCIVHPLIVYLFV